MKRRRLSHSDRSNTAELSMVSDWAVVFGTDPGTGRPLRPDRVTVGVGMQLSGASLLRNYLGVYRINPKHDNVCPILLRGALFSLAR